MKKLAAFMLVLLPCVSSWAEPSSPEDTYKQPYPHSSGAELLPYCEQTDVLVSQLRCDYYVQGVADLATIPRLGRPMACIPQGQNRTQLMQIAVNFLKMVKPEKLEKESAASLILNSFIVAFPCPKGLGEGALKKAGAVALSAEALEGSKKCILESQKISKVRALSAEEMEAVKACVAEAQKLPKAPVPD